jgi:MFS family permease
MAALSATCAMVFMLFFDSILSLRLEEMGVPENDIGYVFAIGCFTYALSSPVVGYLCKKFPGRVVTQFSFICAAISLFLLGPSELLHFPEYNNIKKPYDSYIVHLDL